MGKMFENKLYKGKVTLLFDVYQHKYTWVEEDVEIKSVTNALKVINKPALITWAANMACDYISECIEPGKSYDELQIANMLEKARQAHWQTKKEAGGLGTLLHKWIEDYINGRRPGVPVNAHMKASVKRFLKWKKDHNVKFLLSEQVIFSRKYKYSGTTDFICEIDGKLFIGDLKTSKGIYAEMLMQTAAYRYAREEEYPEEKIHGMLILRIGSDGTFEVGYVIGKDIYKKLFMAFVYALNLSNSVEYLEKYRPAKVLGTVSI